MAQYGEKAGGNTSSSKRPYDMLKCGAGNSPDVKAWVGRVLASGGYFDDTEYGLPNFGSIPEGESEGNGGNWQTVNTTSPVRGNRSRPKRGNSGKY